MIWFIATLGLVAIVGWVCFWLGYCFGVAESFEEEEGVL